MFEKFIKISWFFLFSLTFAQNAFDPVELNDFYDEFVCEEKDVTFEVDLTQGCTGFPPSPNQPPLPPPNPPIPPPPPPPPAPPPKAGYLPIVLVNNTGLPNSQVFFVIFGTQVTHPCPDSQSCQCPLGNQTFVSFGPHGSVTDTGSIPPGLPPSAAVYSYHFAEFTSSTFFTLYVPEGVVSGEIMFSIGQFLPLFIGPSSIAVPNPSLSTDPSYHIVYGQFEFSLFFPNCQDPSNPVANLNQLSVDTTAVDYFGLPIQYTLFSGSQSITAGVLQTRHNVISSLQTSFNSAFGAASIANWNTLVLTDPGKILRILSPGESMFGPPTPLFDINYFDNPTYGFRWAENVWYGSNGYYRNNKFTITTSQNTFTGQVNLPGDPSFVFSSTKTGETYTIPWQTSLTLADSTSASLFNVSTNFPGMTYTPKGGIPQVITPANASSDAIQITKILSSAIIAGIIPGRTNKLSNSGPSNALINTYYTPNTTLPNLATTGPWFDLYSKGLIGTSEQPTGNIVYAYPYDDYLYAQSPTLSNVAPSIFLITPETYLVIQINEYSDN